MVDQDKRESLDLTPYELSEEQLLAIGRIVRAFAEIEDYVQLFVFAAAGLTFGQGITLVGRRSISGKLELAKRFAASKGGNIAHNYDALFGDGRFRKLIDVRNTFVHGRLLGQIPDGRVAFQVADILTEDPEFTSMKVHAFAPGAIAAAATESESVARQFRTFFAQASSKRNPDKLYWSPEIPDELRLNDDES